MKNYLKHFYCLSFIVLVIAAGCKKDGTRSDMRDSLVGTYAGDIHFMATYTWPNLQYVDSVIKRDTFQLSKSGDSSIVISGIDAYRFFRKDSADIWYGGTSYEYSGANNSAQFKYLNGVWSVRFTFDGSSSWVNPRGYYCNAERIR